MFKTRICLIALGIMAATQAVASEQSDAKGFVEDSGMSVLLRNHYINRDYKNASAGNPGARNDGAEWGQAAIANFTSGFTQGTVGVGVDAFGLYAVRLDGGSGRSGNGGIDFFKQDSNGNAAHDLSRLGGAIKFRISNTVLKYGEMMPSLPVLNYDDSRLLPETFTGTMITSKEIKGLELNAGHFTAESRKSATGRDSGGLNQIDVLGGSYTFNDKLKGSLYGIDIQDVYKQQYLGVTYVQPLDNDQSLTLDFNGYRTNIDNSFADAQGTGDTNRIWSLAATYAVGPHSFTVAHQRSSGSAGYPYGWYQNAGGVGNGGSSIFLSNSYWSDFNAEDEHSWQLGYGLDFTTFGVPGLSYKFAYVRGDNITTPTGDGTEREIFNQFQYIVQSGVAKDLKLKARSSILRVSDNAHASYMNSGNEVRLLVEYPINVF
jgi:hypothetical protein